MKCAGMGVRVIPQGSVIPLKKADSKDHVSTVFKHECYAGVLQ